MLSNQASTISLPLVPPEVVADVDSRESSYEWTVPETPTTQGKIFVGQSDGSLWFVSDKSDGFITVELESLVPVDGGSNSEE